MPRPARSIEHATRPFAGESVPRIAVITITRLFLPHLQSSLVCAHAGTEVRAAMCWGLDGRCPAEYSAF